MTNHSPTLLASALRRTVDGPMWHGPALREVLREVSHEQAVARPVPGAHSIWELVLHMTAWAEIVRARLQNRELAYPPPERDWPSPAEPTARAWSDAMERLAGAYLDLAHDVRTLIPAELDEKVGEYTVATMLHGLVEHGCYHGGQVAILKRALHGGTREPVP